MSSMTVSGSTPVFGHQIRDAHFLFDPQYVPLNHGSFGTYPKSVRTKLREYQDLAESKPDTWVRYDFPTKLYESIAALAEYLDVPPTELALVPNATTGINTVLRSLVFERGDVIVHLSTSYGAVAKAVDYICEITPAESYIVKIVYPIEDMAIIEELRRGIEAVKKSGKTPRIAIFDTISALPGVRVPWERLCEVCKDHKVLSLVDGAHSVGQIKLDLGKVQPDFFTSNCHK